MIGFFLHILTPNQGVLLNRSPSLHVSFGRFSMDFLNHRPSLLESGHIAALDQVAIDLRCLCQCLVTVELMVLRLLLLTEKNLPLVNTARFFFFLGGGVPEFQKQKEDHFLGISAFPFFTSHILWGLLKTCLFFSYGCVVPFTSHCCGRVFPIPMYHLPNTSYGL